MTQKEELTSRVSAEEDQPSACRLPGPASGGSACVCVCGDAGGHAGWGRLLRPLPPLVGSPEAGWCGVPGLGAPSPETNEGAGVTLSYSSSSRSAWPARHWETLARSRDGPGPHGMPGSAQEVPVSPRAPAATAGNATGCGRGSLRRRRTPPELARERREAPSFQGLCRTQWGVHHRSAHGPSPGCRSEFSPDGAKCSPRGPGAPGLEAGRRRAGPCLTPARPSPGSRAALPLRWRLPQLV